MKIAHIIILLAATTASLGADRLDDVEIDDVDVDAGPGGRVEDRVHAALAAAMRRPELRRQLGQVLPVIRVMSPPQRLALAALLTSQVVNSGAPSYDEVAAMFGIDPAASDEAKRKLTSSLLLPISYDIARMFRDASPRQARQEEVDEEVEEDTQPPEAQEYRYLRPHGGHPRRPPVQNRRNALVFAEMRPPPPPPPASRHRAPPDASSCKFFSDNVCLEVTDYPKEAIITSLRATEDALDEFLVPEKDGAIREKVEAVNENRRQDGEAPATMCASTVKLARPKRARTTDGQWKYIVNTGHYTQTLRLEMCRKERESCSYISDSFQSECAQVYNYHRLLTWDELKGLHMDIFKVPTCCSCQVRGYAVAFPPARPGAGHVPALPQHPDHYPGVEIAVDNTYTQQQNYDLAGKPFQGPFSDQPLDETHLSGLQPSTHDNDYYNLYNRRPHLPSSNLVKRGDDSTLGLTPPRRSDVSGHAHAQDRIHTVSERPSLRPASPERPSPRPASPERASPRPASPERPSPLPASPERASPRPASPDRASPRPASPERPSPRPTSPERASPRPASPERPNKSEQKVNYSYHPIIDFFKTRTDRLESRSGEGWTPIVPSP